MHPVDTPSCLESPKEPIPQEGCVVGRDDGLLLDGDVEDGVLLGCDEDGTLLGTTDGLAVGVTVGKAAVGSAVGKTVGIAVGVAVGAGASVMIISMKG